MLPLFLFSGNPLSDAQSIDLIIRNGHVIDPRNEIDGVMDVAIDDGKIVEVAEKLSVDEAGQEIDAAGLYITPGLIDIHGHIFWGTEDHAYLSNCGVKIIFVENRRELEAAINDQTAMLWFLNANNNRGQIKDEEWIEVGKKYGIPTMNDCAADVPPVENLWKYTDMGFDLVCFSGGKGIRGPQSAGLLLGRRDLIAAARLHAPPRGNTIGRGMKVNKEEVLGMTIAVERYVNHDHEADWKLWEAQIQLIADAAGSVPGVEPEIHVPDIANHVPSLRLRWDERKVRITPGEARESLRNGHPSIETVGGSESLDITTWMMNPGEERIVAMRVKEILEKGS